MRGIVHGICHMCGLSDAWLERRIATGIELQTGEKIYLVIMSHPFVGIVL